MQITNNIQKNKLVKNVWSKDEYYDFAAKGSSDVNHPVMINLKQISKNKTNLLDMGCGEGTRLANIADKGTNVYGIDISPKAIEIAKKKYPKFNFHVGNLEKLPYANEKFDLVYSAFVLEHLDNPKKAIKEGIRVLKKGSSILVAAPNYGAPNRASPPFKGNRFLKLVTGFVKDFVPSKSLNWQKVKPIADSEKYESDWDTVVEPYAGSLARYLRGLGLTVTQCSTGWRMERKNASLLQRIFRMLGEAGIYPFKNWGPHLLVIARK